MALFPQTNNIVKISLSDMFQREPSTDGFNDTD